GFYVRALAEGLFREPPLDARRRERLRGWVEGLEPSALARWAARLDSRYRGGGRQRAARVLEMALLTGRPLSWWQAHARETGVLDPWYIHLTLPREVLHRRIAERVDRMLAAGLVDEVRGVLARGVPPDAPGLDAVGYREVVAMLTGRLPAAELRRAIVVATRQYAKRQETWFRHQLRAPSAARRELKPWALDATEESAVLAAGILERWRAIGPRGAPRAAHHS
ncbi:MAG TPA: tRNA dimethylallyltransferase, partial [Gemmatimonadales bacterium]|nr:tRNA dimethylallyltransferase [Gemmatimonadales bacterium]